MNNMEEVYKKLKDNYKYLCIKLKTEHNILITINQYKIEVFDDLVEFTYKNKNITHTHVDNYNDVYQVTSYYLDNKEVIPKKQRVNNIIAIIVILFIVIIVMFVLL